MSQSCPPEEKGLRETDIVLEIQAYCSWFQIFGCVAASTRETCWRLVMRSPDILTLAVEEEVALQDLSCEVGTVELFALAPPF